MVADLLQLAWSNLLRARARLLMTVSGVIVGTTTVILLIGLTVGLQNNAEAGLGSNNALTQIKVYPDRRPGLDAEDIPQLDAPAVRRFRQIDGVAAVIPLLAVPGSAEITTRDAQNFAQLLGVEPANLPYLGVDVNAGSLSLEHGESLLGGALPELFFDPAADTYEPIAIDVFNDPLQLRIMNRENADELVIDLTVSGVITTESGEYMDVIMMRMDDVLALVEWYGGEEPEPESLQYAQIIVRSTSRNTTNAVASAIQDLGYRTVDMGPLLDEINEFFLLMRLVLGLVGGVALLVAAFGVANTMSMAIVERTSEIGVMKALGARDRDVLLIYLIEAGFVGLLGGLCGAGLSLALQRAINNTVSAASPTDTVAYLPFEPSQLQSDLIAIPAGFLGFALVIATVVGLLSGFWPALRAARMPPVAALRHE